jgi:hypothetical protein
VQIELVHLSGPSRGRTALLPAEHLVLGTEGADVPLPHAAVRPRHAEIRFVPEDCHAVLTALDGPVFVNRREIREVVLASGDLLEVGVGGPRIRYRERPSDGSSCKPLREMLSDARDICLGCGVLPMGRALGADLLHRASWRVRILAAVLIAGVVIGAGYAGAAFAVRELPPARPGEAEAFGAEVQALRAEFLAAREAAVTVEEVERLRVDLERRTAPLGDLALRDEALRRMMEVYPRGVGLVHGAFTLISERDGRRERVAGPDGAALEFEYLGTGFLVSSDGQVVTNRHVAEPWWRNQAVEPLIARGLSPAFVRFEIHFPGLPALAVDPSTVVASPDADVALFRIDSAGLGAVPVLPLFRGEMSALKGDRVVLMGYPTGIGALLARSEPAVAEAILRRAADLGGILAALGESGAISPVITQGALNEVRDRRLVYDAQTTSGGSGGPVFGPSGEVVGVNFAVTRGFTGSNFGVPVDRVLDLLRAMDEEPVENR